MVSSRENLRIGYSDNFQQPKIRIFYVLDFSFFLVFCIVAFPKIQFSTKCQQQVDSKMVMQNPWPHRKMLEISRKNRKNEKSWFWDIGNSYMIISSNFYERGSTIDTRKKLHKTVNGFFGGLDKEIHHIGHTHVSLSESYEDPENPRWPTNFQQL